MSTSGCHSPPPPRKKKKKKQQKFSRQLKSLNLLAAWWANEEQTGPASVAGFQWTAALRSAGVAGCWDAGAEGGWSEEAAAATRPCLLWKQSLAFGCWAWARCSWGYWHAWQWCEDSFLVVGGSGNRGTARSEPGRARGTPTALNSSSEVAGRVWHQRVRCSSGEKNKNQTTLRSYRTLVF